MRGADLDRARLDGVNGGHGMLQSLDGQEIGVGGYLGYRLGFRTAWAERRFSFLVTVIEPASQEPGFQMRSKARRRCDRYR